MTGLNAIRIQVTGSHFASAVVLVRKRSGALRMCCDFRALNAKTVKDAYPLPRIDESMDALAGARWFSTLDLQSAYTQVPMHPDDQHKTAFTTPFGLYEHRRMAFGLCNAPATFQRLMQTAFREEMFSILLCYLDDVLVFSSTIAEQLQSLDTVFTRLREYGLKLELKKCAFFQSEVQYLGHRVSAAGIATDPEKVAAVERWPRPETLKQLRSFMGFASYYRRYVSRFTAIASPLNALITTCCRDIKGKRRSSASFQLASRWNEKCEEAFSAIKLELTSAPVLVEEDAAVGFLALRKVALRWFDEVEGATTSRVKAQVSEARAEPTDTQREFTKLWGEVAENKKLLTQVLAQQREMLTMCAGAPSSVPATPQRPSAPAPRRPYGDLECYQCHQKGHIRRHCPMASLN